MTSATASTVILLDEPLAREIAREILIGRGRARCCDHNRSAACGIWIRFQHGVDCRCGRFVCDLVDL